MNVELQTEHLIMRPPGAADFDDLLALHDDPAVLKAFGETSREEVAEWIATSRRDWEERGHGRVVIRDREDGTFLGRTGLRHWPEFAEVEVGWTLTAAARGRGVATEAACAWIDWGFRELDAPYFTAMIAPWNAASIAVAERLGMAPLRDDVFDGAPVRIYAKISPMVERRAFPPLQEADLSPDPFEQFARWYELAAAEIPLADAMTLATVGDDGAPDARMVLLKGHGPDGFRFFTNYESAKAGQIAADPRGALILYWREHDRQVRARGPIERLPAADSDAYFASRARASRLGAWASPQSRVLADRPELDRRLAEARERFDGTEDVPRPDFWGGFVLRPETIEFWQGQQARLHDRFRYSRDASDAWRIQRLAP